MRVLQLTDTHLRGDDALSFGVVDTRAYLERAMRHLKALSWQPDALVLTGDLADSGDEGAYRILHDALSSLGWPVYAVPGNHDRRDRMRRVLGEWCPAGDGPDPFICYTVEGGPMRLVMADTLSPGSHSGHCHPEVAAWLRQCLAAQPDQPTLLFMHHPPFLSAMGAMDEPFSRVNELAVILADNPQVRLCCGHMHRPIFTTWQGRFACTAPAVSMQIELDLSPEGGDTFRMEAPGYLLHHFYEDAINTHVCQIPGETGFDGPYPFAGSVNPAE